MARNLPALRPVQDALMPSRTPSAQQLSRVAMALAPDILRIAERIATDRLQSRQQRQEAAAQAYPHPVEGVQLSEVQIDVSFPFIQRVTMRNATAWSNVPGSITPQEPAESGRTLKRLGLIGTSSALALAATVLARRVGPFAANRKQIIDVAGRTRE